MHTSSLPNMRWARDTYLIENPGRRVLDVGSRDVNGNYRFVFESYGFAYTGYDICPGPNVDLACPDLYKFPLQDESFDAVISGQTIEHVPSFWEWSRELKRVLKVGGRLVIVGPWQFSVHRFPVDCWRILPDGMRHLLGEHLKMKVLYAGFGPEKGEEDCDVVGVAEKEG